MKYVVLAVASDAEAERLIEDLTQYPGEPLRTPRWGNAVYATLTADPAELGPVTVSVTGSEVVAHRA